MYVLAVSMDAFIQSSMESLSCTGCGNDRYSLFCAARSTRSLLWKVICAVYGPHAQTGRDSSFSEEGQLKCDFSYAPFATPGGRRESRGGKKDDERELSTLLRQTLESSVQVSTSLTLPVLEPILYYCSAGIFFYTTVPGTAVAWTSRVQSWQLAFST